MMDGSHDDWRLRKAQGTSATCVQAPVAFGGNRLFSLIFDPFLRLGQRRWYRLPYVHGSPSRVHLGPRVSLMNTLLNTVSGDIYIGANTILGHNCMLLTGRHEFTDGRRRSVAGLRGEVPHQGHDIRIGADCWLALGVIVSGGVTIGDNVVVAAGSCVVDDIPSGVMIAEFQPDDLVASPMTTLIPNWKVSTRVLRSVLEHPRNRSHPIRAVRACSTSKRRVDGWVGIWSSPMASGVGSSRASMTHRRDEQRIRPCRTGRRCRSG